MSLSDGQNANAGSRRMAAGGSHVNYELYRDAAMSQRFGQTENVDRLVGSGTGNAQTVNVYGRIPAAQSVPAVSKITPLTLCSVKDIRDLLSRLRRGKICRARRGGAAVNGKLLLLFQ